VILEISVGQPQVEGRYVVFMQCASHQVRHCTEPHIATWHGGKWHARYDVLGWIGPLPVMRVHELAELAEQQEYDL
jgi:hypothetical protein